MLKLVKDKKSRCQISGKRASLAELARKANRQKVR
jgi:hypothetical protein